MEWGTENKREEDTILTLAIFALWPHSLPVLSDSSTIQENQESKLPGTLKLCPACQNPFSSTHKCPHLDTSPEWWEASLSPLERSDRKYTASAPDCPLWTWTHTPSANMHWVGRLEMKIEHAQICKIVRNRAHATFAGKWMWLKSLTSSKIS